MRIVKVEQIILIKHIGISVPKTMINKEFCEHNPIDRDTYFKVRKKLCEIELAIHQLQNIKSILEIIESRWIPASCKDLPNTHTCIVGAAKATSQINNHLI
jgi:hypothetical protein